MNTADWIIVALVGISGLISLFRGFVKEALSLAAWCTAFLVALYFSANLAELLKDTISAPSLRHVAAFMILLIATLIVGAIVNFIISHLVHITGLTGTDRFLGMIFGVARGLLLVLAIVIMVPSAVPINEDAWYRESTLIPQFEMMRGWALQMVSEIKTTIDRSFS